MVSDQASMERIARIAHEANRAYCRGIGDSSQPPWDFAPEWQKKSAIAGVAAFAGDREKTPEQMHESWMAHKVAEGWVHGEVKSPDAKTHPCLVPYGDLPAEQRVKDALFLAVCKALLGDAS